MKQFATLPSNSNRSINRDSKINLIYGPAVLFGMAFLFLILVPLLARAQAPLVPCNGVDCNVCHLYEGTRRMMNFLLYDITLPMFVVAILWGGFLWLTSGGSEQRVSQGKQILGYALTGFLIAFGAWVIVNTLLDTLGFKIPGRGNWNDTSICSELDSVNARVSAPSATGPTSAGTAPSTGGASLSEVAARNFLAQNGITGLKNPCPAGVAYQNVTGGCTSLDGMKQSTLDAVVAFKDACVQYNAGCAVKITGGSELGHATGVASHATGDKVDIAATPIVTSFIRSTYTPAGTRPDGAALYKSSNGIIFADEGNHIDTTVPI